MSGYHRRSKYYHDDRAYESRAPPAPISADRPALPSGAFQTSSSADSYRASGPSDPRKLFAQCRFYLEQSKESSARRRDMLLESSIKQHGGEIARYPQLASHVLLSSPTADPPPHIMVPPVVHRSMLNSEPWTQEMLVWEYGKVYKHSEATNMLYPQRRKDVDAVWKDWAWRCLDEGRMLPVSDYEVIGYTGHPPNRRPPTPPRAAPPTGPSATRNTSYQPRPDFARNGSASQPSAPRPSQLAPVPHDPRLRLQQTHEHPPLRPRAMPDALSSESRPPPSRGLGTWESPARLEQWPDSAQALAPAHRHEPRHGSQTSTNAIPLSASTSRWPPPAGPSSEIDPPTPASPQARPPSQAEERPSHLTPVERSQSSEAVTRVKTEPLTSPPATSTEVALGRHRSVTPIPIPRTPSVPIQDPSAGMPRDMAPPSFPVASATHIGPRGTARLSPTVDQRRGDPTQSILPTPSTSIHSKSASPQIVSCDTLPLPIPIREASALPDMPGIASLSGGMRLTPATRVADPLPPVSDKIFQTPFGIPFSFHLLCSRSPSLSAKLSLLIEHLGGGEIVSVEEATYLVMHRDPGSAYIEGSEDIVAFSQTKDRKSRMVVSHTWIDECTNKGLLLDHRPFLIEFEPPSDRHDSPHSPTLDRRTMRSRTDTLVVDADEVVMLIDGEDEHNAYRAGNGAMHVDAAVAEDGDDDDDLLELASDPGSDYKRAPNAESRDHSPNLTQRKRKKRIATPSEYLSDSEDGKDELEGDVLSDEDTSYLSTHAASKRKLSKSASRDDIVPKPLQNAHSKRAYPHAVYELADEDQEQYEEMRKELKAWLKNPTCGRTAFLLELNKTPRRVRWDWFFKKYQLLVQEDLPGLQRYTRR